MHISQIVKPIYFLDKTKARENEVDLSVAEFSFKINSSLFGRLNESLTNCCQFYFKYKVEVK